MDKHKSLNISVLLSGLCAFSFPFAHDYFLWSQINLGFFDTISILLGLSFILLSLFLYLEHKYVKKIGIRQAILLFILALLSAFIYVFISYRQSISITPVWRIQTYHVDVSDSTLTTFNNPKSSIFQAEDIDKPNYSFVADPIVFATDTLYYMFYEAFDSIISKGVIGLSTSKNALNWTYHSIVLSEPFHLSFPYVFEENGQQYMIPESSADSSVRLYKASNFPAEWKLEHVILHGKSYRDNVVYKHKGIYYLFTSTNDCNLELHYSSKLHGIWKEHPMSPIYTENCDGARMAGPIFEFNRHLYRSAQDDYPSYGNNIKIFIINDLDTISYQETEVELLPAFKGRDEKSRNGVHTFNYIKADSAAIFVIDVR